MEASLYIHCKELGITLLTVSLRQSLIKFHDYQFSLDGDVIMRLLNKEVTFLGWLEL